MKKSTLIYTIIVILFGFAIIVGFSLNRGNNTYSPPTQEEIEAGNTIKAMQPDSQELDVITADKTDQARTDSTKTDTPVVITDASQYNSTVEVRAFMPNIEQEGICYVSITKDSHELIQENVAHPDASSTICTNQAIPFSDFPETGKWQVTVSFESSDYKGKSEPATLLVEKP